LKIPDDAVEPAFLESPGDLLQFVTGLSDVVTRRTRLIRTAVAQCPHLLGQGAQS